MGTFSGLQVGLSALYAQRRGLDVTGHNIANVNTEGYSRQRVDTSSDSGPITPAFFARWEGTGMGVRTLGVARLRDQFLEVRGYQEHAADSHLRQAQETLGRVELSFGEPSDTGLAATMADYWAGWDDVANRPDDVAARSQLLQRASTLAAGFRQLDGRLAALRSSSIEQLEAVITEVNVTAARIAELNETIQAAVGSGLNANDLADQRDRLISELSDRVGASIRPNDDGTVDVFVGGTAIVRRTSAEALEVYSSPSPGNPISVRWTKDQATAVTSGRVAGLLQSVNDILPRYRAEIEAVADAVRTDTNALHMTGFDRNGNPGIEFFVATPSGIDVNPLLMSDGSLVAAAATPGTLDGSIAAALAGQAGPDARYRQLVVNLGVEVQSINRRVDIQAAITEQVDGARESVAGVNLDEEMTQLIAYQHAYDAAARFVTSIDSMLETLIRSTGLVGR